VPELIRFTFALGSAVDCDRRRGRPSCSTRFRDLIPMLRLPRRAMIGCQRRRSEAAAKAGSPAAALGAADELAAAGRFVEAMHVLLLQGLAAIRSGLDEGVRGNSLTSRRDPAPRPALPDPGRTSLRDHIVNRVGIGPISASIPAALPADYEGLPRELQ